MSDSNDFHVAPEQNPDCDCLFCESERARIASRCDCGECSECIEIVPNLYQDDNESMDGDFDSGMSSAGFGTSEDYGDFDAGDDW